jgi:hypothetical protein
MCIFAVVFAIIFVILKAAGIWRKQKGIKLSEYYDFWSAGISAAAGVVAALAF